MLPNNHADAEVRLEQLVRAVKRVYASTFLTYAKNYFKVTPYRLEEEKMAVIIQKMVGSRHGSRFYPELRRGGRARTTSTPAGPLRPRTASCRWHWAWAARWSTAAGRCRSPPSTRSTCSTSPPSKDMLDELPAGFHRRRDGRRRRGHRAAPPLAVAEADGTLGLGGLHLQPRERRGVRRHLPPGRAAGQLRAPPQATDPPAPRGLRPPAWSWAAGA